MAPELQGYVAVWFWGAVRLGLLLLQAVDERVRAAVGEEGLRGASA